ncbi:HNH endonuclease signature motif containing protein [Arthrobacter sp. HLT1-20]
MGGSRNFPESRDDSSTTASVADLVAGLALPSIEPLSTDMAALLQLPKLPSLSAEPSQQCQLFVVRDIMNDCVEIAAALTALSNRTAAALAAVLERFGSAAAMERGILGLDTWQNGMSVAGDTADLASVLGVTATAAACQVEHSAVVVRSLPATMAQLESGGLAWSRGVVVADETSLLRECGIPAATIDDFESLLLEKARDCSLNSFKGKARRLRERLHPESVGTRTRQAFEKRSLRVSRAHDGMSWLSLYAPAPTVEGIWDQCTLTAQGVQGPHESRTLTQLRADVAAALLLNQALADNQLFAPLPPTRGTATADANYDLLDPVVEGTAPRFPVFSAGTPFPDPDPFPFPDPGTGLYRIPEHLVPVFDDPDYQNPGFRDPDIRNNPDWCPSAAPPTLKPVPAVAGAVLAAGPESAAGPPPHVLGQPPMPQAMVLVTVPALSLLGLTNAPAVLEGYGPISIDVAKRLLAGSTSFYRVLTDPITNQPLDLCPDTYRVGKAMRLMLRGCDEYCQFPGCTNKASLSELDHLVPWESGGKSVAGNLDILCKMHHQLKHFKDNRTRSGQARSDQGAQRQGVKLRGWTPHMTDSGRPGWTSPSGRYHPPESLEDQLPGYPKWLKKLIDEDFRAAVPLGEETNSGEFGCMDQAADGTGLPLPEPPPGTFPDDADVAEWLVQQAILEYLASPHDD